MIDYEECQREFKKHPKVIEAKRLMDEAWDEIRTADKTAYGEDLCKCGHKRKDHNPSHSINYTQGSCRDKKCDCLNYLQGEPKYINGKTHYSFPIPPLRTEMKALPTKLLPNT